MKNLFALSLAFTCILLSCCTKNPDDDSIAKLKIDDTFFYVEITSTKEEMAKGLMHRKSLEENHGMLFVFPSPSQQSFWMKNTYIPLDLGYFSSDGTLLEIHPLYPHNTNRVISRSNEILYALEMNQGWFETHNIRVGAQLDMPLLKEALKN